MPPVTRSRVAVQCLGHRSGESRIMRSLIVSKTRMKSTLCVGAITVEGTPIRLLTSTGQQQPINTAFNIGQVWNLTTWPSAELDPPHMEDVLVQDCSFERTVDSLRDTLLKMGTPCCGDPEALFDRVLHWTSGERGYISRRGGVPSRSTGFWIPNQVLQLERHNDKPYFVYLGGNRRYCLPYVGCTEETENIPAGALVRVSLARWWQPPDAYEERCYLQLSGWYR